MKRQIPKIGDVFWVPIDDGTYVLGQIVEIRKEVLNSITCAFFADRTADFTAPHDLCAPLLSVQFVTRDLFATGHWIRVANSAVQIEESRFPHRNARKSGWIGATVVGSGNIRNFLSAYYDLRPWNEMNDPNYYDRLMLGKRQ